MKKNKKPFWRKLDDQAKIFSLSFNKKDTSVFRLSIVLKEKIDKKLLEKAVIKALDKYKAFKVKMKKGLFWYYLEENFSLPIISKENDYPFKKVDTDSNNNYLFKVTYYNKKINIDYFHTLTDGNSGTDFFKEIVYSYLELRYPKLSKKELITNEIISTSENSYKKNYKKNTKKAYTAPKAFQIKGKNLKEGKVGINHFKIKLNELKKMAQIKECSISILLVTMFAYSIYETNFKKTSSKKPINVCIPINLKKYFPSKTISNFVSYMMVSLKLKKDNHYKFDDILNMVKKEFANKLKPEKIEDTMNSDGKKINNFIVRIVPLAIKKLMVVIGSFEVKRHFTTTFSNLGKIEFDPKYNKYISDYYFVLAPDWAEKVRCGVCSNKNSIVVTFGTNIKDNKIENKFKSILKENKIKYKLESNGINSLS